MKEKLLEALTQWQEKKNFPISDDDLGEIIEIAYGIVQSKINLTTSERDKEIVEMMYRFIRNGEFSGSFADGCDCKECDKYEIKSKKKFIKLINNTKTNKTP